MCLVLGAHKYSMPAMMHEFTDMKVLDGKASVALVSEGGKKRRLDFGEVRASPPCSSKDYGRFKPGSSHHVGDLPQPMQRRCEELSPTLRQAFVRVYKSTCTCTSCTCNREGSEKHCSLKTGTHNAGSEDGSGGQELSHTAAVVCVLQSLFSRQDRPLRREAQT